MKIKLGVLSLWGILIGGILGLILGLTIRGATFITRIFDPFLKLFGCYLNQVSIPIIGTYTFGYVCTQNQDMLYFGTFIVGFAILGFLLSSINPIAPGFQKILKSMQKQYGKTKGRQVFYAWINKRHIDYRK